MAGRLTVLATPIGNLEDLSGRARRTLAEADVVVAEDTRRTLQLLRHLGLERELMSLPAFDERRRVPAILARLDAGEHVVLCSDAGMPAVSDPGAVLVAAAHDRGVRVDVIPGPSAVVAAVAGSGLGGGGGFTFLGFLPRSPTRMRRSVEAALVLDQPVVVFEAAVRLARTLETLSGVIKERPVVIARELTKVHETFHRGTAAELAVAFRAAPPRGECTIVIGA
ncbi:MAG: 16S rRNA (cytidine(1402)-2'-O)-methyltransferase [Candidatus Dormibacteria bacterium]